MVIVGDALLEATGARLINYELLGNSDRALHAHINPRYADEPDDKRRFPVWEYHRDSAIRKVPFDAVQDRPLMHRDPPGNRSSHQGRITAPLERTAAVYLVRFERRTCAAPAPQRPDVSEPQLMYVPSAFRVEDRAPLHALMRRHSFATLVTA